MTPLKTSVLGGGEVLLVGADVLRVRDALATAVRAGRADGVTVPAHTRALVDALDLAARLVLTSAVGTSEVLPVPDRALSRSEELIEVAEAAVLLGCTDRNVRLMCKREAIGSARRIGSRWVMDRAEIIGRVIERAS